MKPPTEASVPALAAAGLLDALDLGLATALSDLAADTDPRVALGVALASRAVRLGDVCLDLLALAAGPVNDDDGHALPDLAWPSAETWLAALRDSPLVALHASGSVSGGVSGDELVASDGRGTAGAGPVAASGAPRGTPTPLVLDPGTGRLYLRRYWAHEAHLARALLKRARAVDLPVADDALRGALMVLFAAEADGDPRAVDAEPFDAQPVDAQCVAAWVAARRPLTVVSGGPGTGKTTTVVRILSLLLSQAEAAGARPPRIALLAPTGKAAARLAEAVGAAGQRVALSAAARAAIPDAAQTVHRALGVRSDGGRAGRGPDATLPADIVVVDEASMVDLVLMRRLVDAVRPDARLILLGDHDQLASVDAGAVLGDLCGGDRAARGQAALAGACAAFLARRAAPHAADAADAAGTADAADAPMAASVVLLTRSHRFGPDSGIGRLARAINAGDADGALGVLDDPGFPDVAREPALANGHGVRLAEPLRSVVAAGYGPLIAEADPETRIDGLGAFRVLCAHRHGPFGVESLNARIVDLLESRLAATPNAAPPLARAVIIGRNDYAVGLFNGDVGIIVPGTAGTPARAYFRAPDGRLCDLAPARLPPHETAFALSVHKAQGSEFDTVAVVLPDGPSPLLTRELLYTAVTRARRRVTLFAAPDTVRLAVANRAKRASGLAARLWG